MNALLHMVDDNGAPLGWEESERLDGIFAAALATPGKRAGRCPFCGDGRAYRHVDGVRRCADCETVWILDSDYQRLVEDAATPANRLALEYQKAHSKPLFKMGG